MRATITTFALALLLAVPLLAGDAALDDLVSQAKDRVHDFSLTPADSIGGVIEKAVPNVESARELVAIVRAQFGLKEETAQRITRASLRNLITDGGTAPTRDAEREEAMRALDRDYALALRSDPSSAAVAREYLTLLAGDDNLLPDAAMRMRDVLRGLPREVRALVALQVMSDLRVTRPDDVLFEAAMESGGLDPLALALAADPLWGSSSAELFDGATSLWLTRKDVESASAAASRAIYAYAARRSVADVLRIYRSLPAEGRAIVSSAPEPESTVRSRGIERSIGTRDVRFSLAAAFILGGDTRAAASFLPAVKAKKEDPDGKANDAISAVLRAAIDSPGGDAFELVTGYLQHANASATSLVDEVFDLVATRAGYSAASKWRLDTVARADERLGEIERTMLPAAVAALLPVGALPPGGASPPATQLLRNAPLAACLEREVDDSARSSHTDAASIVRPLPPGFDFVRMDAYGDEVVAVALSQAVDPAGLSSGGGYWVLRSTDRGATWNPPLYTGLRYMQPYEVVIGSTLPMLRRDGVRIEVATTELDGAIKHLAAVDFQWRDLERDSDHDGLTDLMEERIFTDPKSADTDSDGVPDGDDPLPQVAFRKSDGDAPKIVAATIELYYGSVIAQIAGTRRLPALTMFIAGDPAGFAGVQSRLRIIVRSEAELQAATAYTRMSPVIIDQTGTRAWVQLNDDSSGATYLLEKRDGVWTAEVVASWVS